MTAAGVGDFAVAMNPKQWVKTCMVVLAMAATLTAQTARPNRIAQGASAGGMVTVKGTVHPLAKQATDLGAVNSQIKLDQITLNSNLSAAQQKDLDTLLAAQQNPKSSLYHHWLTQEQYGARFGLTDADLKAVTSWLTSQGFAVTGVSKSRNSIHFSGQVWQVESAFHTQMHRMELNGQEHIANTSDIQLPAAMASVFMNIRGLDNFRPKPRVQKRQEPAYSVSDGTTTYNFLSPADWATIYNVTPIYSQSCSGSACDGTGMHVGIVGQTSIYASDVAHFRTAAGLSTSITYLNTVCIDPTASHCTSASSYSTTGDLGEADLDIEWAGGIAKNATVDYIYAPYEDVCSNSACTTSVADPKTTFGFYSAFDALEYAVKDYTAGGKVLPVVSMSYGDCELSYTQYPDVGTGTYLNWVTSIGQQANSQGQTLVTSSGDSGPFTCEGTNYPALSGVYVDIPADSPNFTGVGGTRLSGDESNPATYWNESSTAAGTALGYISETVWNDTAENVSGGNPGISASGGGISTFFSQPSWQSGLVSGQTTHRLVPDLSFAASANHDGYLICSTQDNTTTYGPDCAKGFLSGPVGGNYYFGGNIYGGTSASSPSFAGMLTLLVEKYGNLGNVNPILYPLASSGNYGNIFHAVSGNNITPCTVQSSDPGCPSSSSFGYTAPGSFPYYSMAAGLGSIDGFNLFSALNSSGTLPTSYVLTPSVSALTIAAGATTGNTVTFTISSTVYKGSIDLTAASSSGLVTAALSSSSVSLASGAQTVTLTISPGASAANRTPQMPWKGGGVIALAALLGVPFTLRRKRAMAVLLTALVISSLGFMAACGGGGSSSTVKQGRTYTVTVTGTATGTGVTNPAAVVITVTVP
jgi:subtilase family serine protease